MRQTNQKMGPSTLLKTGIFLSLLTVVALLAALLIIVTRGCDGGTPPPSPTPAPEPTVTVTRVDLRFISELATVKSRVVAEVQDERVPDDLRKYLGIKEKILMLVYADVKAGFDLGKLSESDLLVRGTQVKLMLPAPEILSVTLDHDRTHIVYYDKTLLIKSDPELVTQAFETADEAIRKEVVELEILEKAETFGKVYLENYLRSLGFTDVQIIVK